MTSKQLKKGVLFSFMWAISHQLNKQFPNVPTRKLRGIALQVYNGYTKEQQNVFSDLKAKAWEMVEHKYKGDVNMPILLTQLYWSFPDVFGEKVLHWIDVMDDEIVSYLDGSTLKISTSVTEWYIELVDKVVFDYLKENKNEYRK